MPITKTASKHKSSIVIFIVSLLISLIPLVIIVLISSKDPNVWFFPYSYYVYATIFTMVYFGLFNGLIACRRRKMYLAYKTLTYILMVPIVVLGFVFRNATKEVSFHIIIMFLFTYCVYQITDNAEDKSLIIFRYFAPAIVVALGLIPCLWFVSVGWTGGSALIAFFLFIGSLIVAIISSVIFHKKGLLENAIESEYEYTELTEEDIAALEAKEDASKKGIELSGDDNSEWKLSRSTIDYLKRSAAKFYNDGLDKLKRIIDDKGDDLEQAKFNLEHYSYEDSEEVYKKALNIYNYYVKEYNHFEKYYKEIMHDIEAFEKRHITSKDYGKYIIFDFRRRYDRKKSYNNQHACKVTYSTFTLTICARGDYGGAEMSFADDLGSWFEFDKIR